MGIFVVLALLYMIVKTFHSITDKEFMDKYNKDGMMGGSLILALIAEIIALRWTMESFL